MGLRRVLVTKRRELLLALTSIAIGLVLSAVIVEVGLRLFFPQYGYGYPKGLFVADEHLGFRFKPLFDDGHLTKPEFTTRVWTNSKGFRDNERDYHREGDTLRILSVGDSFTWGAYGVEAEGTFSALLEQLLAQNNPERAFEVINTGVFGYGTDNELRYYLSEGHRYDVDLVIVNLFVGNDFFDNLTWGEVTVLDGNLVATENIPTAKLSLKNVRAKLLEYSYFYTAVERGLLSIQFIQRLVAKLAEGGESQHVYGGQRFDALVGNSPNDLYDEMLGKTAGFLREFHQSVTNNGQQFALVIIPPIYQVHDDIRATVMREHGADEHSLVKTQRDLRALGKTEGFPVIDLLPAYRQAYHEGKEIYWTFNPHLTPYGNEVTARTILDGLRMSGIVMGHE
jgi:lysophospholipase L1-like esterase